MKLQAIVAAFALGCASSQPVVVSPADLQTKREQLLATAWFTAERVANGARLLLRGRRIERDEYLGEIFPVVVTIEHHYDQKREDGLPTKQQHDRYGELVLPFTEAVEGAGVGVHVFGDTTRGLIREWFYVRDVNDIAALAKKHLRPRLEFEIFYEDDPSWKFFDDAVDQIRGERWTNLP